MRQPAGTTMQVGQISTSRSTIFPGVSGSFCSWVWNGRKGKERSGSVVRCEARSQPCPIGVCGSSAPWNATSFPSGSNTRSTAKMSASMVEDEMKSFNAEGPVISVSFSSGGVETKAGPLGARQRPFVLLSRHEFFARVAHVQQNARLPVPAVVDSLEEIIEKTLLQLHAVVGVEGRTMRAAMNFEPFLFRNSTHESFEISARVQALPAPVRRRKQRRVHLRQVRRALAVIRPVHLAPEQRGPHALAVLRELFLPQCFRSADGLAGDAAPRAALALAVLHGLHLHVLPVLAEAAEDAAVAVAVAVAVAPAFPHADCGEVRRLRRRGPPLVARVIGDAVHADLAARPGLRRGPFHAPVDVARLARVVVA